ncbi:MAG: alpha/beta fold hydrolase [Silvibacterium sp.]
MTGPIGVAGRFDPIELSDPAFEHEYLRNLTFYSPSLRGRGDVSLFVPPGLDALEKLPIVILLHGVYSSHWSWFLKGGAHRTALELIRQERMRPMLMVAPSDGLRGDGTGYIPGSDQDYEAWICSDLIACIKELFCPVRGDADIFLTGLSMGGHAALRLGAKYPDRFRGISAHSAITQVDQFNAFVRDMSCFQSAPRETLDVLYWIRQHRHKLPPLRFDCGREDALLDGNCALHQTLEQDRMPHEFKINDGDHSWPYWQAHVGDSLLFFERILKEQDQL